MARRTARAKAASRPTRSSLRRKSSPPPPVPSEPEEEEEEEEEVTDLQQEQSAAATPEEVEAEGDGEGEGETEDAAGTPGQTSDLADDASNAPSPQEIQVIPRKRRGPGRPPRNRPPDWDTPDLRDDVSDNTPRRKRGRPAGLAWRGGFRGRGRGGTRGGGQATRVPIDKDGNMADVENDEVVLPEDPDGENKVDKDGHLLDGREYRVRTFTILGRGNRLYMLSTEPARCTGFRDSYLFFTKHLSLFKVIINDDEKHDLIDREVIPHSYKGRAIGVVTARSVFREFGAKIVVGGKRITDDYRVADAKERGDKEGELADPFDKLPQNGEEYNRNQFVAWHGASAVYHTNQPTVPLTLGGRPAVPGKRKANITSANWMLEHAREASKFNVHLAAMRRDTLNGIYDPHTNLMCYPRNMQPTHARWEFVPTPNLSEEEEHQRPAKLRKLTVNGDGSGKPNGVPTTTTTTMDLVNGDISSTTHEHDPHDPTAPSSINPVVARNYLVVDTFFETPPSNTFPAPGAPHHPDLAGSGASRLPELSAEDMLDLPEECRIALLKAKERERQWTSRWDTEGRDGHRGKLKVTLSI